MILLGCRNEPKGLIRQISELAILQENSFWTTLGIFAKFKPWASADVPCCLEFMSAVLAQAD